LADYCPAQQQLRAGQRRWFALQDRLSCNAMLPAWLAICSELAPNRSIDGGAGDVEQLGELSRCVSASVVNLHQVLLLVKSKYVV
jgi:hypothetical protein